MIFITFGSSDGYEFTKSGCVKNLKCFDNFRQSFTEGNKITIVDRLKSTDYSQLEIYDIINFISRIQKIEKYQEIKIFLPKMTQNLNFEAILQNLIETKLEIQIEILG